MAATAHDPVAEASPEAQSIATLRVEDALDGVFACTRKERQISRAGSPYLTIELRDSTGTILGRAFRDADLLAGRFDRGDLVRVRGRVERFRDELQVAVSEISRAEGSDADPASFLPVAYRDIDELDGFLEHLAREVYDPGLRGLLGAVLGDEALRAEIRRAPCSIPAAPGAPRSAGVHHAYLGGLIEHTVAVATLVLEVCVLHPRLDRDVLLTAAITHDLGKTREFIYGADIEPSREGSMLGHIELGLRIIDEHARRLPRALSAGSRSSTAC